MRDIVKEQDFLAARSSYEEARAVIVGAPLDATVSFRPGTRGGPAAVRAMSYCLEEYSLDLKRDLRELAFHDLGDVLLPPGEVAVSLERIETVIARLFHDGKTPFLLGGEHLVTLPAVRAAAARRPGLAVIQLDAHADLRDEYLGVAFSHATVMRRIGDFLGRQNLFQFGIRSADAPELEAARESGAFYTHRVLPGLVETVSALRDRPVYVSLDIDVVDPAFAPGVGTPEPAGITSQELLDALRLLRGLRVVGWDVVEVNPAADPAGITALLAARIVRDALLGMG
ncbi:agmatinase [Candidatus Desulforudis audaxviator]|uniref:agmatinase n=1 Tax=Candidatus Desulforudis audaxviator TaxID=471827 RepID=UPI0010796E84|nr:agmatinase [Candidatus Desulforudis audaxviator]AZK60539.1 Agmatinase [Candidatus Desulforudis audaxviator]